MKLLDPDHPFFVPLWRRVATTVVPILWSLVEFTTGEMSWGFIFLAMGLYAGLSFFWPGRRKGDGG